MTPTGTQYVASVVAAAFSSHFADIKPPKERKDHQLTTISTVTLRRLMLETLQLDKQLVTTTTSDGLLRITVQNISVSSSAVLSGELREIKLQDNVTFRTANLRIDTAIRIMKNAGGNPALKVSESLLVDKAWRHSWPLKKLFYRWKVVKSLPKELNSSLNQWTLEMESHWL